MGKRLEIIAQRISALKNLPHVESIEDQHESYGFFLVQLKEPYRFKSSKLNSESFDTIHQAFHACSPENIYVNETAVH